MSSPSAEKVDATWFGPLGERTPDSSGQSYRSNITSRLNTLSPTLTTRARKAATSLEDASENQGFSDAASMFQKSISGDYLKGSPQLTDRINQIQSQAERSAANTAANQRGRASRAGIGFSTVQDQSNQADRAAARADAANTASNIALQNYQQERQNQIQAPTRLASTLATPASLLQQANQAQLDPESAQTKLMMQLFGGGTVAQPQLLQKPGTMDQIGQYASLLSSLSGVI